ncbi:hypothetical protein [Castellaniella denitrificans]|uniref:DUF3850 domain-containing protein n=1 Tax=Castellaniella denitrificans TaxID=56119 RepID=A0ABT4M6W7_9BURK|nr:hypothetical protein [Castellaniella denitrificans]MCZ4331056.1 hypothetical protein [Castellaniella denitrificans]
MTQQTVEIADLVKPKFKAGQIVYLRHSDTHGIESIRRVLIEEIRFTVSFKRGGGNSQHRQTDLVYDLLNAGQARESDLFASPEDAARERT